MGKSKATRSRLIVAKSNVYKLKLTAIAARLETLDDMDRGNEFNQDQQMEYDALKGYYRRQARNWIQFRKTNGLATDTIAVEWS